jgi:carboxylesterase type B
MAAAPVPSASVPAATVPAPAGAAGSGPAHGDDVLLLFGTLPLRADSAPRWMSERIVDYWLGFVRDGEPRASGSPEWPRAQPDAPAVLRLGALITVDAAPGSARLDAWDRWFSDRTATR